MKVLPPIAIHRPEDPAEVFDYLRDGCLPLAGGTELLLAAREGLLPGVELVDIRPSSRRTSRFRAWRLDRERLEIGALLTHSEIIALARRSTERYPAEVGPTLASVVNKVGNIRVRNQGTLGGNLAFGEPRSDWTTTLVALGAHVRLDDGKRERAVPLGELLVDAFYVDREPGELMTSVNVELRGLDAFRYRRWAAGERPMANVAGAARSSAGDGPSTFTLAIGACTPVPVLLHMSDHELEELRSDEVVDGLELFDVSRRAETSVRHGVARLVDTIRAELLVASSPPGRF